MYRIGLTGGVGSGKSTVSNYMHTLGIPVIDGDKLAREAVTPGSQAMARMEQVSAWSRRWWANSTADAPQARAMPASAA